ncbi:MAG: CIA30 family protein [Akkermansiaceae bacterium]|nr:CIA30 family protein [Akkermansiaceae bacterium]
MAEFSPEEAKKLDWRVVNDGVMGGLSKGKLEISDNGILTFSGNLSLKNNGGFSSLRSDDISLDLSKADGLALRVKGDGRSYQIRLGTKSRFRGMEVSFMAEFPTKKDKWTELEIPFSKLEGTFRGMRLKNEKFNPAQVRRIGLLLADKKPGSFGIQVDWIRTYGGKESDKGTSNSIVTTAVKDGRFKTLAAALKAAGLAETLAGKGPFTVFAPTDEAFAKLPKGTVEDLLKPENKERLQSILTLHVTPGTIGLADALKAKSAKSLQGSPLGIRFAKGKVRVNDAAILDADVDCGNGVIHVIDSVLLPPPPQNDILAVANNAGSFTTLLAAVKAAGLEKELSAKGPITLLAPTDEAFARLPKGTVESLLKKENLGTLRTILSNHAISGKISAGDALNAGKAKTIAGANLQFSIKDGTFKVNESTILATDIACDNGVIHVIDAVLLPKEKKKASRSARKKAPIGALKRIENAIDIGVPIFNSGNHKKCAAIYRECLMSLAKDKSLDGKLRKMITTLIERGANHDSAATQAWLYRSGLDKAYNTIERSQG